jgi:hypothetical protein
MIAFDTRWRGHHVADHVFGRRAQLVTGLVAPQHFLDLRPHVLRLVAHLDAQLEDPRLRFESLDDPEAKDDKQRADRGEAVQANPRGEARRQGAQHHDGVLRVVDLRPIANQVGGADDAERASQAGADHQHDQRANHGEDDLRLHHGGLPFRRAAAARPQRQHRTQQRGQRKTDGGCQQLLLQVVHYSR